MTRTSQQFDAAGPEGDGMPHEMAHLDPELRSLAASLDLLGIADRAGAANGFEDRLMQATLAPLHAVEAVAAQSAELGAADRAGASADLEAIVFARSLPTLLEHAAPPVLRHTGHADRDGDRHVRVVRRAWWASSYMRMAAALALVAGAGLLTRSMLNSPTTTELTKAERVTRDLDLLFAVIDSPGSSESGDSGASEPEDLTKFLLEGTS